MIKRTAAHASPVRVVQETLVGLTPEQVLASRAKHGENHLKQVKRRGLFSRFLENFGDPIIKILLVALAVNLIFAIQNAGWFETVGIAIAVLLATLVSTISEYGSESAFAKLQEESARVICRVKRSEGLAQVPIGEIVVGDLVLLQTGERVPADGVMVRGELDADQSSLNGEAKEARKMPGGSGEGFMNRSLLFSGSVVCAGEGVMRVESVGDNTFLGKLAGEIQEETRESPLKVRLAHLAGSISKLGIAGAVLVALADLFNFWLLNSGFSLSTMAAMASSPGLVIGSLLHAVTLAVTVIVVAVPEGLPMMITVVLSSNMRRMLRDNVLVRKLVGIETAGSMNILFTDKTGTLTQGKLRVATVMRGDGTALTSSEEAAAQPAYWRLLHAALRLNNAADLVDGAPVGGNATDRALLAYAADAPAPLMQVAKIGTIPFSSENKFMATTVSGDLHLTLIKGAPERILAHCTRYYGVDGRPEPLFSRASLEESADAMARRGMRVLAAATSDYPVGADGRFERLTLVGLIGVRDPLRSDAAQNVRALQDAGVQVVMITGDGRETAEAIAREAGLLKNDDLVMTSAELASTSDAALCRALPRLRVVSRALPADKSRLVRLAQESGAVAGMTGDGVNDAPALKKADIGFAMGSGTEVAKEAGDIVILDDRLSSIAKAVLYGRTIFRSIRKFVVFQLTVNLCAVGISVIAPLVGVESPVTVLQMLWINMVMDTLAGLAFSGEPALDEYMLSPPLRRDEPVLDREMLAQIGFTGAFTALMCLWFLVSPAVRAFFRPETGEQTLLTAFFALFMYAGVFNSLSARTSKLNLLDHILGNKGFIAVMGCVFLVQTALVYFGGSLFRAYGLTFPEWITCVALAALVIPADLVRKFIRNLIARRNDGGGKETAARPDGKSAVRS